MKRIYLMLIALYLYSLPMWSIEEAERKAITDLIERIAPGYASQFRLELIPADNDEDVYEVDSDGKMIVLRGNNSIALATAFNQYLKYTCHAHVSWFGNQLNLPKQLPQPVSKERTVINGKYRIYLNYCTVSYSASWWDWERWQRELDFMAMNSINMPLSVIGLDAVWYNTLLKYGLKDEEARRFLAGPAHSAWQWMQNLEGYCGPLPKSWIDKHIILGKQIMERQLELGMKPIQQGFSGYVPREFKQRFPKAKIRLQPSWVGFTGVASLDPTDSLFITFGHDFLEEQKRLFGAHGNYAADPFHESKPPVDTPEYLKGVGETIHKLLKDFDPNALWVMQAWSLREHILKAVPQEDMLILDLNGRRSQQENAFWGYPFIAGNLHNFGGRINLHGDLRLLASNQYLRAKRQSPNIVGSGLFMEGIEQNPVYYDLAFEMPLHHKEVDIENWLLKYAERRYGGITKNTIQAWKYLLEGPYRAGTNGTENSSIIAARPALNVKKSGPNAGFSISYDPQLLFKAEELLLKEASHFKNSSPYRFDIVDVQRQLMSNLGQLIHKQAAIAFKNKDTKSFNLHSTRFLELLHDVDILLRTRSEFNFDRWLSDARRWGDNKEEQDLLEKDATALVTIWGADGDPLIFDYGWREWSGLIEGHYLQRWTKFYQMLKKCLETGKDYSEEGLKQVYGRESFRANEFYQKLADWEMSYVSTPGKARYPIVKGDEIKTVRKMYKKYFNLGKEYYIQKNQNYEIKNEKRFENLGE